MVFVNGYSIVYDWEEFGIVEIFSRIHSALVSFFAINLFVHADVELDDFETSIDWKKRQVAANGPNDLSPEGIEEDFGLIFDSFQVWDPE